MHAPLSRSCLAVLATVLAITSAVLPACDDPVEGPIGGVIFTVRTFASAPGSPFAEVESIRIDYERVVAVGTAGHTVLDSQPRSITLTNADAEILVAQYQVPVGDLGQIRFFATAAVLTLKGGAEIALDPETSDLPSWRNSGWKVVPDDGEPFVVVLDDLIGVRASFRFDERLVHPQSSGNGGGHSGTAPWKIKPTVPAEQFDPNPAENGPGILIDHVTFVAMPGVTAGEVSALATVVGATVVRVPHGSRWYRIKLPVTLNLEDAITYFNDLPESEYVLPAINLGLNQVVPDDDGQAPYGIAKIDFGWEQAQLRDPNGLIGSHVVRAAVVEGGVDVTHPDLRRNISIHQGELPPSLFNLDADVQISATEIAAHDCDPPGAPDGVISIRDMECDAAIAPPDVDGDGIDARDVISDTQDCGAGCWADGEDNDGNDFTDDLFGWDFVSDDNDPGLPPGTIESWHATFVAGIIGAEGDNGQGIAGLNWRSSIVGLRTGLLGTEVEFSPAESVVDALTYSEDPRNAIDVVNMSIGWVFEREGADRGCADKETASNTTAGIPDEQFNPGVASWTVAFAAIFRDDAHTFYSLAAGNSSHGVSDDSVFRVPFDPMNVAPAVTDRVLSIGALEDASTMASFSIYGAGVVIYAPGVRWRSLIPSIYTCSEIDAGPFNPFAHCSESPCPLEGNHEVCLSAGTSFSAPTVTGAAALLAAVEPAMRYNGEGLRTAIIASSAAAALTDCDDDDVGGRLLDVEALLTP